MGDKPAVDGVDFEDDAAMTVHVHLVKREQKKVDAIKQSKYALGKNPENLTKNQQERLELIQAEDPQIKRGHDRKEKLRLILKLTDSKLAEEEWASDVGFLLSSNSDARSGGTRSTFWT